MRKVLMLSAILSLAACARNTPIVTIPPAGCAKLIPTDWADGVEAAPIPTARPFKVGEPLTEALAAAIVAPWATGYVAMSGQLEKANGRTRDAMTIVDRCETMVNAARPD